MFYCFNSFHLFVLPFVFRLSLSLFLLFDIHPYFIGILDILSAFLQFPSFSFVLFQCTSVFLFAASVFSLFFAISVFSVFFSLEKIFVSQMLSGLPGLYYSEEVYFLLFSCSRICLYICCSYNQRVGPYIGPRLGRRT
jgi:hypothetical protein